jgi:hypothetical protein
VLRAFGLIMLIGTIVSMLAIPLFAARRVTPTDGATS